MIELVKRIAYPSTPLDERVTDVDDTSSVCFVPASGDEAKTEYAAARVAHEQRLASGEVMRTRQPAHRAPPPLGCSVVNQPAMRTVNVLPPNSWAPITVNVDFESKNRFAMQQPFVRIFLDSLKNLPPNLNYPDNLMAQVCVVHHPAFATGATRKLKEDLVAHLRTSKKPKLPGGHVLNWQKFQSRPAPVPGQALWQLHRQLQVGSGNQVGGDGKIGGDDIGIIVGVRKNANILGMDTIGIKLHKSGPQELWFLLPLRDLGREPQPWPVVEAGAASGRVPTLSFGAEKTLRALSASDTACANGGSDLDVVCHVKIVDGLETLVVHSILQLVNQSSLPLQGVFELSGEEATRFDFAPGAVEFAPLHMIPSGSLKLFLTDSTTDTDSPTAKTDSPTAETVFEGDLHALLEGRHETLRFRHEGRYCFLFLSCVCDPDGVWEVSLNPAVSFCNLMPVPVTVRCGSMVVRRDDGWLTELRKGGARSFNPPRHIRNGTKVRVLQQVGTPPELFAEVEAMHNPELRGFTRIQHLCEDDADTTENFELTLQPAQTCHLDAFSRDALERGEVAVRMLLHEVHGPQMGPELWSQAAPIPFPGSEDVARGEVHFRAPGVGGGVFSAVAETSGNTASRRCTVRLFASCWVVNRSGMQLAYSNGSVTAVVPLANVVRPKGFGEVNEDALVPVTLFSHRKQLSLYDSENNKKKHDKEGVTMRVQRQPAPFQSAAENFVADGTYRVQSDDGEAFVGAWPPTEMA